MLTGSWDGTARLWPVPQPLPDDEARITAWVETMTGLRIPGKDAAVRGVAVLMTEKEWTRRRAELFQLGGPLLDYNQ